MRWNFKNKQGIVYFVLPAVILFSPLTILLKDNEEPLFSVASLTLFLIISFVSVFLGVILAVSNTFMRVFISSLMAVFAVYAICFPSGKPEVSWIPFGTYGFLLLITAIAFLVGWLARDKLGEFLLVVFGVLWLSIIVLPSNATDKAKIVNYKDAMELNKDLPRYIHIILDQHIGIEGIDSSDSVETANYKDTLIAQYVKNGFDVYGRAYSHHNKSMYSFPAFMNFYNGEQPGLFMEEKKFGTKLAQNKLFELLTKQGYRINLYQTNYVEMCNPENFHFNKCESYIVNSLFDKSLPNREKIITILDKLAERFMLKTVWRRISAVSLSVLAGLPEWPTLNADRFSSESLRKLEQLKVDIIKSEKGQAFFAQIMLPHHPYHFDSECRLTWIVPTILEEREEQGYYLEQMKCVQKKIEELILSMKEKNIFDDSIIIIHGDHGSRIIKPQPASDEPPSNKYISWHSTFFAVHKQGNIQSKYHMNPISVTELMRDIHGFESPIKNNNDPYVYIMPNGFIPDDYKFKKVSLPPFLGGEIVENW